MVPPDVHSPHTSPITAAARRRAMMLAGAVTVGVVAFGFRLITVRDLSNDHYMHLAWAQQALFGDLPGRDFVDPGMPLMYTLSAFVQWMSAGPFSEAVLSCVLLAVASAVIFIVAADLANSVAVGLVAALFAIAFFPRLYSYPKLLVPAVALLLIQQYVRRPSRRGVALLATWTAIAVLLRHDLGVYAAAGIGIGLVWTHWGARRHALRALIEYVVAVVVAMIPYVLFVQWAEGLTEHFHEAVEFARGEAHERFLEPPAFAFLSDPRGLSAWSKMDSAVLLFYAAHLLVVAALVLLVTRREPRTERNPVLGAGLMMLVLYLVVVLRHPIDSRIQDVDALMAIMGAWVVAETGRRAAAALSRRVLARLATASTFLFALVVAAASTASLWDLGNITLRIEETRVMDGLDLMKRTVQGVKETGTQWPWERFWPAGALPDAVRYLNACTTPNDAVLLTWAAPEYYYFSQRRFGAGHALFLPPDAFTTAHDQALMLARLRKERVPIVLINETRREEFANAYRDVDTYLTQEYVRAGRFQIHDGSDVTIAIHRDLKADRAYGAEGWPCGFTGRSSARF